MTSTAKLRPPERFPWLAALLGATLVVVGGVTLLRFPNPPNPDLREARAAVTTPLRIVRTGGDVVQDERLRAELALQDPTPLFLPTQWNSGQANPAVRRDPPAVFSPYDPALQEERAMVLPVPAVVPEDALATVGVLERGPKFLELGRRPLDLQSVPGRWAKLEVSHAATGQVHLAEDLAGPAPEAGTPSRQEFWAPMELLLVVNPAGLVGRPAVVASSGSERVDNWAVEYLSGPAALGARLAPGFYRVVLGP